MKRFLLCTAILFIIGLSGEAWSHDQHGMHHHYRNHHGRAHHHYSFAQALQIFRKNNPCPSTWSRYGSCPGFVIVKQGRVNHPSRFYWQAQ
ncbi:hypothetical protein [Candidatus Magnetaquicoccus inordinatus]|uniref:hypothetical protein n=1 Tax=Candidatus Magnetaquicoccus inordinatus TaxID=2496818 RepID=UPI00102D0E13|nr:hypothetical protein [Candidatus Magnetaquicoccus inordinatus]